MHEQTVKETYTYYNFLKTVLDTSEVIDEVYLVYSALDVLYELYTIRRDVPMINKDIILNIIYQNLHSEIKESLDPGFRGYTKQHLGIELDVLNDLTVATVGNHLFSKCADFLDLLIIKGYTIEESRGNIPVLVSHYTEKLGEELSQIIIHLNNSDKKIVDFQYVGWGKFLRKNRIYDSSKLPELLRLTSAAMESKLMLSRRASQPLTSLGQLIDLENDCIVHSEPIGSWGVPVLDELLRVTKGLMTLCVGAAGLGKTTLGSWMAGNLLEQGKRVLFYCPEIPQRLLLFSHILPAYIYAKYGFCVTMNQLIGNEPLYEHHEFLSLKEREDLVKAAKLTIAESGLFYHVAHAYHHQTLGDELRRDIRQFDPDILIFDHTTEVMGEENQNLVTSNVAEVLGDVSEEFLIHTFALSHTGSKFTIPTKDTPVVTEKICAWSKRLEGVAANVVGMFKLGDKVNMFFTKLRWHELVPMWITLRMDREHNWFTFEPKDQFGSKISDELLEEFISEQKLYDVDDDEDEGEDYFAL